MLKEAPPEFSRWERGLVRQVRTLHPEQLKVELTARRYRHRFCFEALVERAEALVGDDPVNACRVAREALRWVARYTPRESKNRLCALSVLGEALSRRGREAEATAVFRQAMELGSAPIGELGALWWRYAVHLAENGFDDSEPVVWASRSLDLLIKDAASRPVGSRESTSVAAAWLARGRVGRRVGEPASKVAKCFLASALETTGRTPRTAAAACAALAHTAPPAWMCERGGFHPWKILRRLQRLDAGFHAAGESKHSPCRCRIRGLEGLALAHLGHSLTPQSESYLSEAKSGLAREGSGWDVVRLNMDVGYILLWEGRWTQLAKLATEALEWVSSEGGRASARALKEWHASLERRRLEPAIWDAAYRRARGTRAPLIFPEPEVRGDKNSWRTGW